MRANIEFDENNYVISLNACPNGDYLLPENFDSTKAFYYRLVDDVLVLDEEKEHETEIEDEKRMEIESLMYELHQSDEDLLSFLEELFSLKNPLTFITDMYSLMNNYTEIITTRKSIRERIRKLK